MSHQLKSHKGPVNCVSCSDDGLFIASCANDGYVHISSTDGKHLASFKHEQYVLTVSFSPDSTSLMACCTQGMVYIYTYSTMESRRFGQKYKWTLKTKLNFQCPDTKLEFHECETICTSGAWSPNGKYIAVGICAYVWLLDSTTHLSKCQVCVTKSCGEGTVHALTFSDDSRYLVMAVDTYVMKWELDIRANLVCIGTTRKIDVKFLPDAKRFIQRILYAKGWDERYIFCLLKLENPPSYGSAKKELPESGLVAVISESDFADVENAYHEQPADTLTPWFLNGHDSLLRLSTLIDVSYIYSDGIELTIVTSEDKCGYGTQLLTPRRDVRRERISFGNISDADIVSYARYEDKDGRYLVSGYSNGNVSCDARRYL